ncbi:MAG TPA: TetR/AcrR family transcriptional regulator [Chthoniobacterales bacterium]|jgi:TetR/AcrR family transcriptional regulator|nr:TetR/AcrR family transcriptional regulator [Chthoniobacterales bacterium]
MRLLKSALRLFSKRGYDAVGVQEIVVSARVTKPALYHYFGSKRGVIESLFEETVEQLLTALRRLGRPTADSEAAIESVIEVFFAFIRSNPAFYRLQLALYFAPVESEGYKAAGKYYVIQRELVVDILRTALRSKGPRAAEWQATTLIGLINCCAAAYLNGEIALTEEVCKSLARQFLHGAISEG